MQAACVAPVAVLEAIWGWMQAMRRQMMPPFLHSLGPITDWLGGMMLGPLINKYDPINQASSVAKVLLNAAS